MTDDFDGARVIIAYDIRDTPHWASYETDVYLERQGTTRSHGTSARILSVDVREARSAREPS